MNKFKEYITTKSSTSTKFSYSLTKMTKPRFNMRGQREGVEEFLASFNHLLSYELHLPSHELHLPYKLLINIAFIEFCFSDQPNPDLYNNNHQLNQDRIVQKRYFLYYSSLNFFKLKNIVSYIIISYFTSNVFILHFHWQY